MYNNSISKIDKVKALVAQNGGWSAVFNKYSGLSQALSKGTKQQPCPLTGKGKTKFRFYRDANQTGGAYHNDVGSMPDGIDVISWYDGCSKGQAMDNIIAILGGDLSKVKRSDISVVKTITTELKPEEQQKRKDIIKRYFDGSQPIKGTPAETYLKSRGLNMYGCSTALKNLRYHPAMAYKEDDNSPWEKHPGLLAVVRDKLGRPLTLHRTFLKKDGSGKADVSRQKMQLAAPSSVIGGFIALSNPTFDMHGNGYIGVAEGIETALSVQEATGCPMWAGISDRLMEKINFDDSIKVVLVWIDKDITLAGKNAFNRMKTALEAKGKKVFGFMPQGTEAKLDWNDIYIQQGAAGFPHEEVVQAFSCLQGGQS